MTTTIIEPEQVISTLDGLIHWLAYTNADDNTGLMDADELVSELYEEIAKGIKHYSHLPEAELLRVLKRMMDHRISELKYKYYMTHRGEVSGGKLGYLVDDPFADEGETEGSIYNVCVMPSTKPDDNPELMLQGKQFLASFCEGLSDTAKAIVDSIVNGNRLVTLYVSMSGLRASYVYENGGTITIQPWHVARALDLDVAEAEAGFQEIQEALRLYDEKL